MKQFLPWLLILFFIPLAHSQRPRAFALQTWRFGGQFSFEQMISSRQSLVATGIWQVHYRRFFDQSVGYPVAELGYRWRLGRKTDTVSIHPGWLLTAFGSYAWVKGYPGLQDWYSYSSQRLGASLGYRLLPFARVPLFFETQLGLAYQMVGLRWPAWAAPPSARSTFFLPPYQGLVPLFSISFGVRIK